MVKHEIMFPHVSFTLDTFHFISKAGTQHDVFNGAITRCTVPVVTAAIDFSNGSTWK